MITTNFIQQYLASPASPASSCLTTQDLIRANVKSISIDLGALLVRPGLDFFMQTSDLRKYLGWDGKIFINGSRLAFSNSGKIQIKSEFDGAKKIYSSQQLIAFFNKISIDGVLLPRNMKDNIPINPGYYFAHTEYKPGFGIYFSQPIYSMQNIQEFINSHPNSAKYLVANIDLNLHSKLGVHPSLMIENSKFCEDAYQGIVYRDDFQQSILATNAEFDFKLLSENCNCYSCEQGFTVAYLHHLFKHTPLLCQRLLISHNVFYASHLPS